MISFELVLMIFLYDDMYCALKSFNSIDRRILHIAVNLDINIITPGLLVDSA